MLACIGKAATRHRGGLNTKRQTTAPHHQESEEQEQKAQMHKYLVRV